MTLFHLAEYILQTHAVQATSYTKARAKRLWRLIVGDKDEIDSIDVSMPSTVHVFGLNTYDLMIQRIHPQHNDAKLTIKRLCVDADVGSCAIGFDSLDDLQRIISRTDLPPSAQRLIAELDLARVARPNGEPTGRLPREACTPP